MPTKKTVQDVIDPQPSEEELVIQDAPSIEQLSVDAPATKLEEMAIPLEAITQALWVDPAGNLFKLDQHRRGEFLLRPYYGA